MGWLSSADVEVVSDGGTVVQRKTVIFGPSSTNYTRSVTRTVYSYPGLTLAAAQAYVAANAGGADVEEINYSQMNPAGAYAVRKVITTYGAWDMEET